MYLLYSLGLSIAFILLLPYFIYQAVRHGKYKTNLKQRLGWAPRSIESDGPAILIHTVSVGEFLAAQSLIEGLRRQFPSRRLVVSTTTLAGHKLARSKLAESIPVVYFPLDWVFTIRCWLNRVNPSTVIILETELWPNFLRECRRRAVPAIVANGRLSRDSHRGYMRFRAFTKRVITDVTRFIMQSGEDAERIISLGAEPERVTVCGNLKYDVANPEFGPAASDPPSATRDRLDRLFGLSQSGKLVIAGSTAAGEEEILLRVFRRLRQHPALAGVRLLIAPRRPERFTEVSNLISRSGFSLVRRSEAVLAPAVAGHSSRLERPPDVILLDTIGELASAYSFADVVFVGGSLVPRGGHNILEAAAHAKPIVVGPYTGNFRQIVGDFARENALVQLSYRGNQETDAIVESLSRALIDLLSDAERASQMGSTARAILLKNRGATDCTLAVIRPFLGGETPPDISK